MKLKRSATASLMVAILNFQSSCSQRSGTSRPIIITLFMFRLFSILCRSSFVPAITSRSTVHLSFTWRRSSLTCLITSWKSGCWTECFVACGLPGLMLSSSPLEGSTSVSSLWRFCFLCSLGAETSISCPAVISIASVWSSSVKYSSSLSKKWSYDAE